MATGRSMGRLVGAHRRRRFARFRLPAIGLAVLLTAGTGSTLAITRTTERQVAAAPAPGNRVPVFAGVVPETSGGRARETSLVVAASPGAVAVGGRTTLTATLTSVATGRPVVGHNIAAYAQRRGGARTLFTRLRTDSTGTVRLPRQPVKHTVYDFVFPGRGGYRSSSSRRIPIVVTPKLGLRRNYAKVPTGHVVTFLGTSYPARPGQLVHLQVKGSAGWRTISSKQVGPKGAYAIRVRQGRPGSYTYRAYTRVKPLDTAYTGGVEVEVAADVAGTKGTVATRRVTTAAPLRLLVTGDSLAFYVGEELRGDRRIRPRVRTTIDSQHSTGLARPEFFNWHARAARQVREQDPEAVVVWIGGNDCQPLRTPAGRWVATGGAGWQGEYTRRAALLMRAYASGGRRVYWVGMPTARKADIDACFRAMTSATRRAALAVPGVTWLDTIAMFSGPDGRYVEKINGVQVRGKDGIHLSRSGSGILARRLVRLLQPDWRVLG
jgi:hypothetical protein